MSKTVDWQRKIEKAMAASVRRPDFEGERKRLASSPLLLEKRRRVVQFALRTFMKDRAPVEIKNLDGQHLWEMVDMDSPLYPILFQAEEVFDGIASRPIWVDKYSGGKDSSFVKFLATEYLLRHPELNVRMVTIRNDTLMDAPQLTEFAEMVSAYAAETLASIGIRNDVIVTTPLMDDRFWVMILGHGYPPFNRDFRPCTTAMKIKPSEAIMRRILADLGTDGTKMAVLIGVRRAESQERADRYAEAALEIAEIRLQRIGPDTPAPEAEVLRSEAETLRSAVARASAAKPKHKSTTDACIRGEGECGQLTVDGKGVSDTLAQKGVIDVYPILEAKTCKVWDGLVFVAAPAGWPTAELADIYGDEETRFGCWLCPLVPNVKDLEQLAQLPGNEWLEKLLTFRADFLWEAAKDANRLHITHGGGREVTKGRRKGAAREGGVMKTGLQMAFREMWLEKLVALRNEVLALSGYVLITDEEVAYIRFLWEREKATGKRGKAGKGLGV